MPGIDNYTQLLLHNNGTNGSTTFIDSSLNKKLVLSYSNAKIDVSQSKFGGASCYLSGTNYLGIKKSSDLEFSGDFTIDCWIQLETRSGYDTIFQSTSPTNGTFQLLINSSDQIYFYANGGAIYITSSGLSWTLGQWYHIALVRYGSTVTLYRDGISIASGTYASTLGSSSYGLTFGAITVGGTAFLSGWMDEIRISKGIARWTSAFTPPISAYTTDSYTKLLLHCNGIDDSIFFEDSSESSRDTQTITATGDAQISTTQSKFGGASALFDGAGDYLSLTNDAITEIEYDDFTIDFWVRINSKTNIWNSVSFFEFGKYAYGTNLKGYYWDNGSTQTLNFDGRSNGNIAVSCAWTPNLNQWYHIALVRSAGNGMIFIDGISQTLLTNDINRYYTAFSHASNIGILSDYPLYLNGYIDEFRYSVGVARWTSNFTPPILEYAIEVEHETISLDNTLALSDSWSIQVTAELLQLTDTLKLNDSWDIQTNPLSESIIETLKLNDTWNLQTNPDLQELSDIVKLSDTWNLDLRGTIITKFQTKLYTILQNTKSYLTDLRIVFNSTKIYATKLYTQYLTNKSYKTDLRVRATSIDEVVIGTLDDFVVKLDGVELLDVDYNSLLISLNLNTTPSNCQFTLARRHDNLDVMLNGTPSTITAENKIEVFDGTRKLFTGYIAEINAESTNDTVKITAYDCRLKMSRASMELMYGGAWQIDANHNGIPDDNDNTDDIGFNAPDYIKFEKNINMAFNEVIASVGGLISGYDNLPFSGSFVPEYVKIEKDYTSLIDELIRQTANCNWYIDENERLRFQKIGSGAIKSLPLASLTLKRGPYDLIIDNVQLNKISSNYVQSLVVKRGKNIIQEWYTRTFSGWINNDFYTFIQSLKEKVAFVFHSDNESKPYKFYTGMNGLAISYYNAWGGGWISYPTIVVQWQNRNSSLNLPDITIGNGLPTKTLYLTSYGKKVSNSHYGEEIKIEDSPNRGNIQPPQPTPDTAYLVVIREENYDQTAFLLDIANFELSQNNKKQTSADLSLLLDAYEYYNLSFSDLINLSNTIQSGIYSNNNGFPLNIDSIQINCATRIVTLHITNYGKSWYSKTTNYLLNYTPPSTDYQQPKILWTVVKADGTRLTTG